MPIGHGVSALEGHAGAGKSTPALRAEEGGDSDPRVWKLCRAYTDEKSLAVMGGGCPYRKPPLVDWDKRPKALERTSAKELGKRAP